MTSTPQQRERARVLTEQIWDSVVYNKGTIYELCAAALADEGQRVWEEEAALKALFNAEWTLRGYRGSP